VLAAHEAAVDPRALIAALVVAFEALGGRIEIAEVAESVIEAGRLAGIRTSDGVEHRAGAVLVAAGSWSAAEWLPVEARPEIRPVKGQILTLGGPVSRPVCARIVVGERFYAVPRADGRLVIGATVEELGFDTRVTAGGVLELLREAYRALPEIAELELIETTAGLRPATPDNLPLIGPGAIDGLVLATGHFRNGILLAPLAAERIASMLAGDRVEELAR
jgi:glycine oxidase